MAPKPVKIEFQGDPKGLERAFERAGNGARDMAADFDRAAADAKSMGSKVEDVGSRVGDQESKFMGVADVLDGLATAFGINVGPMVDYARAAGDITGGIENLKGTVGGAVGKLGDWAGALFGAKTATEAGTVATNVNTTATTGNTVATKAQEVATKAAAVAQGAFNAVMNLNPAAKIALAVAALAGAIIVAYRESKTFRTIVHGAFKAIQGPAKVALGIVQAVAGAIKSVLEFLGILDSKTTATKENVVRNFRDISAQARQAARDTGASVPSEFVGGRELVSHHSGGVVAGPRGMPRAIMALGGERILSPGQSSGATGVVVNVYALDPRQAATSVRKALVESVRLQGPLVGVTA